MFNFLGTIFHKVTSVVVSVLVTVGIVSAPAPVPVPTEVPEPAQSQFSSSIPATTPEFLQTDATGEADGMDSTETQISQTPDSSLPTTSESEQTPKPETQTQNISQEVVGDTQESIAPEPTPEPEPEPILQPKSTTSQIQFVTLTNSFGKSYTFFGDPVINKQTILSYLGMGFVVTAGSLPDDFVAKSLTITADKTSLIMTSQNSVKIQVRYTENAAWKPVDLYFSALDEEKILLAENQEDESDVYFSYIPETLGVQTIEISTNDLSRKIDIEVLSSDPIVHVINYNNNLKQNTVRGLIGKFFFSTTPAPVVLKFASFISDIDDDFSLHASNGIGTMATFNGTSFVRDLENLDGLNATSLEGAEYYIKLEDSKNYTGEHTLTIENLEVIGLYSRRNETVVGLPVTLTFTIE